MRSRLKWTLVVWCAGCPPSTEGLTDGYPGIDTEADTTAATGTPTSSGGEEPPACPDLGQRCPGIAPYAFDVVWAPTASGLLKIDAETRTESARFETRGDSPAEGAPVRVAVNFRGDAVVVNDADRWISIFAGDPARCIDGDGDGLVTAEGPGVALPWGADECRRWYRTLPPGLNARPVVAWNGVVKSPGNCLDAEPWLWIALRMAEITDSDSETRIFYIHPLPENASDAPMDLQGLLTGEWYVGPNSHLGTPVAGVTDSHDNFWFISDSGEDLWQVDAQIDDAAPHGLPKSGSKELYAIAVDRHDVLWMSGQDAVHSYEPAADMWTTYDLGGDGASRGNGVLADMAENVWIYAQAAADAGPCRLQQWGIEAATLTSQPMSSCDGPGSAAGGVSLDGAGGIWLFNRAGIFHRVPGGAPTKLDIAVVGSEDTYDATGMGMRVSHPCAK